jgi:CheY-like chemotaxis protein
MEQTPYQILIVDLNANVRDFLRREFLKDGYLVSVAKDGVQLCEALAGSAPPHLVLLDPDAPFLADGPVMERFKRLTTALPVVLHTYCAEKSQHPLAKSCAAMVEKSGDVDKLKAAVKQVLLRRHRAA